MTSCKKDGNDKVYEIDKDGDVTMAPARLPEPLGPWDPHWNDFQRTPEEERWNKYVPVDLDDEDNPGVLVNFREIVNFMYNQCHDRNSKDNEDELAKIAAENDPGNREDFDEYCYGDHI